MSRLFEIYGIDAVLQLDESSLPLTIGTDEGTHIRLEGEGGTLAYVGESRGHLFLQVAERVGAQPIYLNDEPVAGSVWLKSGDTLRSGEFLIRWSLSGQRVEVRVSRITAEALSPPVEAPDNGSSGEDRDPADEPLHPALDLPRKSGRRFGPLLLGLFLLLLVGVAFVLLAKPLVVTVSPAPDSMSISGFPLTINLGDRFLGIPGSYVFRAEKSGYRNLEQTVQIAAGNSRYHFELQQLPGIIELLSRPPGATVTVDGRALGTTPLPAVELEPGERRLRFEHPRYLSLDKSIVVAGGGVRSKVEVELQPAWAKVLLRSEPEGAILLVDGVSRGVTPVELELLSGERKVEFNKERYSSLTVVLSVTAGATLQPEIFKLKPAPARITLTSTPKGATVSTDGQFKGQTPVTLTLRPDVEHQVRVSLVGYLPYQRKFQPVAGEQVEVTVDLKPEYGTVFIAAIPPDANLTIDGRKQQQATGRFRLTTRAHKFTLQAPGYKSASRTITPRAGYSQRVEINLQQQGQTAPRKSPATTRAKTGLGQKLILVKPEPFLMGASRREPGRRANEREHRVRLAHSFYLSEREVTNGEFRKFQPQHVSGVVGNRSLENDSHPVVNVSWVDAARFLNWLSQKDDLPPFYQEEGNSMVVVDPKGIGYRLPSEAEWAFVARKAGRKESVRYPWSGKYPPKQVVGNFADESGRYLLPTVIEGYNDGYAATSPVGSFPANVLGVYDLGGNVAEWCHDYYAASPGTAGQTEVDPLGAKTGSHHVVRGSSWSDASLTELRFSYRRYSRAPANDIGFRIARYAQ